jgi:hypothetical protein
MSPNKRIAAGFRKQMSPELIRKRTMITKLEATNKALSALGGLHLFRSVIDHLDLRTRLSELLPAYKISTKADGFDKFQAMCLGLVAEADCLDDMDRLSKDPAFTATCGHVNAANTYGDYLRQFNDRQIKGLQRALIEVSLALRAKARPKAKDFIVDLDSTSHVQSGKKIEGCAHNYKNEWCLDTLEAYDQFGFPLWMDLRPGNTFTANGAASAINEIFKRAPRQQRRYLRVDSGYCNVDVFNAAYHADVAFVAAMRQNMLEPLLPRLVSWKPTKRLKAVGDRHCEIAHTLYYPAKGRQTLRVVVIRALKNGVSTAALFDDAKYDYYAWVTNIGHHEMTNEEIILFYRGRGNAENFIREQKNGFDLKHLPCLKLLANKAYAMIVAFAFSLMRYMAFVLDPRTPRYSKVIRFRMVRLACQVVRHARSATLRFHHDVLKEVKNWSTTIDIQFGLAVSGSQ